MIPEWLSLRKEFWSSVKFVWHSHNKIVWLNLRRSRPRGFRARSDTHASLAPNYTNLDPRALLCMTASEKRSQKRKRWGWECRLHDLPVLIRNESPVSVYMMAELNFVPEREFQSDWKSEWAQSGMTCSGTKFRFGKIQRNIWRWDELVPEWKSFQYHLNSP